MDSITIDGMDEHDFRYSIEDMLRLDEAEGASEKLRGLIEPHVRAGLLPPRFLDVSEANIEVGGWNKLGPRLLDHDRRGYPISAIGVVLADAKALGGPGAKDGRLAPFVKTYYFSDEAYPFTDASRADLLDGYSRDGFDWQGDYQATDATLSIKGIDDLYGAVVALEDRLLKSADPDQEEIRAGTIGACYLAVLIHRAITATVRKKGLPRPLCVLAACDGVYPFFNAPVAGQDEYAASPAEEAAALMEQALPVEATGEELVSEGSLLDVVSRKGTKSPVILVSDAESEEACRFTEMAGAQRMAVPDDQALKGLFHGAAAGDPSLPEAVEREISCDDVPIVDYLDEAAAPASDVGEFLFEDQEAEPLVIAERLQSTVPEVAPAQSKPIHAPTSSGHSLRARIRSEHAQPKESRGNGQTVVAAWLKLTLTRLLFREGPALSR